MEAMLLSLACRSQTGDFNPIEQALVNPLVEFLLSSYIDVKHSPQEMRIDFATAGDNMRKAV